MTTEVFRQSARLPLLGTPVTPVVGIIADAESMNKRFTLVDNTTIGSRHLGS